MKKTKALKAIITIILIILQLIAIGLMTYALILYKGVETFYRIFGIIIVLYFFFFLSYLLLKSIKKKKIKAFIVPLIITIILIIIEVVIFYYLNKVYKAINAYSDNENTYYSSLVTYDKTLTDYKKLDDMKIGIVSNDEDIEGNIIPTEIIKELKLEDNNKIIEYDSTLELLYGLKDKEVDAAFFSSNYIDMFSPLEGFETIEEETIVIYQKSKVYESNEEEIKSTTSSLTKPFTMLLIGIDSSTDGVTAGYNADVLLLATFNPSTLRATMTSIPRDMYLKTACSGNTYRRINTTTWGSSSTCAVQTIENLFDVDIDYYAKINFKGIVKLVDSLGGIDVDVPYSFCEQNSSRKWGSNTVFVKEGFQHLNGEQALALSRNRHYPNDGSQAGKSMGKYCANLKDGNRNDYTRGKNQMKVILGIANAGTKLNDPNTAIEILETISSNFQTNVTTKEILSLYDLAKSLVISDNTNLINIQRMQLKGYSAYGLIYDTTSKNYPAVTIPYKGSINDIKKEINNNLSNKVYSTKTISFDINKPYEDTVIGTGNYSESRIATLKDLSKSSVQSMKEYASDNNLTIKFIDYDTDETVDINDFSEYYFHSQKEHKDIILNQLSTLTIYVRKRVITITPTVSENESNIENENNIENETTENTEESTNNNENNSNTQNNEVDNTQQDNLDNNSQ